MIMIFMICSILRVCMYIFLLISRNVCKSILLLFLFNSYLLYAKSLTGLDFYERGMLDSFSLNSEEEIISIPNHEKDILITQYQNKLEIRNLSSNDLKFIFFGYHPKIIKVAVNSDLSKMAILNDDMTITAMDLNKFRISKIIFLDYFPEDIFFLGRRVLISTIANSKKVWEIETGDLIDIDMIYGNLNIAKLKKIFSYIEKC